MLMNDKEARLMDRGRLKVFFYLRKKNSLINIHQPFASSVIEYARTKVIHSRNTYCSIMIKIMISEVSYK